MPAPGSRTLLAALRELAGRDPQARALAGPPGAPAGHGAAVGGHAVPGFTWLSRAELLARADALPADGGRTRVVPTHDPVQGVVALLAAQSAGAVAVVADETWDGETVAALRGRVEAHLDRWPLREPQLVVLTSGSSGAPRAVRRTAASWDASLAPFTRVAGIGRDDVVWLPGSIASTLTLFGLWHALATGVPALATGRWRGPADVPAEATVVHCVPAIAADVLDARRDDRLPALRRAIVAGAGGIRAVRRRGAALRVDVVEYYGAAELSFVAADRDGTGLRAFPGVEVRARDGILWSRSPYLAAGYVDGDGPLRIDDGWASVGDRGEVRPDGTITVAGRGEDGLSVGGQVVIVSDVEAVLAAVDGVAEVVCLGEPHARLGERVVAVVRPVPGTDPVPALRAAARRGLPPPSRPVRYVVLADLPRTAGGKVARAVLRERVTTAGRGAGR